MSSMAKTVEVHKISLESDLKLRRGPGEIPQLFNKLAVLTEDLGLVPRTLFWSPRAPDMHV